MTNTTYSQSAKGVQITRERLIKEMADHQIIGYEPTADEMKDVEEACQASAIRGSDLYSAAKLLSWLGY
jgi:hypothetical protein